MHAQDNAGDDTADGASPWLWATLLALLVVVPTWWWARNSDESFATDTRPAPAASRQILPTSEGPRAMTMIAHQPARAAISTQEAIPLPGNAVPSYPSDIAQAGIAGSRTARLQLDVQGRVSDVSIVDRSGSNDPRLDAAVMDSLRQWRFSQPPAMATPSSAACRCRWSSPPSTERDHQPSRIAVAPCWL